MSSEFHCTFSISYKIQVLFIIIVFGLSSDKLSPVLSSVFPQGSVTGCDSLLGEGWTIFHFRVFKSILFFANSNSFYFFQLLHSTNMLCLLLLYLIMFQNAHLLFLRRIFTVLSQEISHGMWLLAWEFLLIKSVLQFAFLYLLSGYYYYDYVVIGVLTPS